MSSVIDGSGLQQMSMRRIGGGRVLSASAQNVIEAFAAFVTLRICTFGRSFEGLLFRKVAVK